MLFQKSNFDIRQRRSPENPAAVRSADILPAIPEHSQSESIGADRRLSRSIHCFMLAYRRRAR
jgi:hypothetical protein